MKVRSKTRKSILAVMLFLSILGVVISAYQAFEHYLLTESICDFTETFSCSAVTGSVYGEFPVSSGIAVSLWATVWFIALTWLLWTSLKGKEKLPIQEFYTFAFLVFGFFGVLYFLFIELYLLPLDFGEIIICPLCTVLHIDIFILLVLSYILLKKPIKSYLKDIFIEG